MHGVIVMCCVVRNYSGLNLARTWDKKYTPKDISVKSRGCIKINS